MRPVTDGQQPACQVREPIPKLRQSLVLVPRASVEGGGGEVVVDGGGGQRRRQRVLAPLPEELQEVALAAENGPQEKLGVGILGENR